MTTTTETNGVEKLFISRKVVLMDIMFYTGRISLFQKFSVYTW